MIRIRTREKLKKFHKDRPSETLQKREVLHAEVRFLAMFFTTRICNTKMRKQAFRLDETPFFHLLPPPKNTKKRAQILPKSPKRPKIHPGCLQITIFGTPTGDPI